jgi:hypothetical protein
MPLLVKAPCTQNLVGDRGLNSALGRDYGPDVLVIAQSLNIPLQHR